MTVEHNSRNLFQKPAGGGWNWQMTVEHNSRNATLFQKPGGGGWNCVSDYITGLFSFSFVEVRDGANVSTFHVLSRSQTEL